MQFTDEHVNKIFQAHRFLYCEFYHSILNIDQLQRLHVSMLDFTILNATQYLIKISMVVGCATSAYHH
jgi:hypothetical protein